MTHRGNDECGFGKDCYRVFHEHFRKFSHAHLELLLSTMKDDALEVPPDYQTKISPSRLVQQLSILKKIKSEAGSTRKLDDDPSDTATSEKCIKKRKTDGKSDNLIKKKVNSSEPYGFFLSVIEDYLDTNKEQLSLQFKDLLSSELGEMVNSLQINYMVDIGWLLAQYFYSGNRAKPITLIYGVEDEELKRAVAAGKLPCVSSQLIKLSNPYSHHHTKMMILEYKDKSIRVIVLTGNLIESDWTDRVQGIWISPVLPAIVPDNKDKNVSYESPTNFKRDLLRYLQYYNLPLLQSWIDKVKNADCRNVKVFLIPSVPLNNQSQQGGESWGLDYAYKILKTHLEISKEESKNKHSLIYQCSSIGSLGATPDAWFINELTAKLSATKNLPSTSEKCAVNLIYPTLNNVLKSYGSIRSAACLPYSKSTHDRQKWLNNYLKQWSADARNRTKAMPHIKTYCRMDSTCANIFWFLLTSANCSKAAWGSTMASKKLRIMSYECGVLLLPQFLIGKNKMPITERSANASSPVFSMPYDVPLKNYGPEDEPWQM